MSDFRMCHSIAAAMLSEGETYTALGLHPGLAAELTKIAALMDKVGAPELTDPGIIATAIANWQSRAIRIVAYDPHRIEQEREHA